MTLLLAAFTGLWFGEVAALRRSAFDLDAETPTVRLVEAAREVRGAVTLGPTKTKGSRRTVPIPPIVAKMVRDGIRDWASDWEPWPGGADGDLDALAFPTPTGTSSDRRRRAGPAHTRSLSGTYLARHG